MAVLSELGGQLRRVKLAFSDIEFNYHCREDCRFVSFPLKSTLVAEYQCGTVETWVAYNHFWATKMGAKDWEHSLGLRTKDEFLAEGILYRLSSVSLSTEVLMEYGLRGLDQETVDKILGAHVIDSSIDGDHRFVQSN